MKTILIFSNTTDGGDTGIIQKKLLEDGEDVFRFDTQPYARGEIRIGLSSPGDEIVEANGRTVSLADVKSVWYRRPGEVNPSAPDKRQQMFAKKELGELLEQLYYLAPQAHWVSRPQAIRNAGHKFPQLGVARGLGFEVPRTYATNSPELARRFIVSCASGAIYKTLYRPAMLVDYDTDDDDPKTLIIPTSRIMEADILRLDSLPLTGGIFQEYVEKEYELRVTVMGPTVFAARIDSQENPDEVGKVDWRMGKNIGVSYKLPEPIAEKCRNIVKHYGLAFGTIDLIKTPDGRYVFLELNPNGQWAWLESLTGDPYIETFVRYLADPKK